MRLAKNVFLRTLWSGIRLRLPNADQKSEGWKRDIQTVLWITSGKQMSNNYSPYFNRVVQKESHNHILY